MNPSKSSRQGAGGPLDPRLVRAVPAVRVGIAGLAVASVVGTLCTVVQAVMLARIVVAVFIDRGGFGRVSADLVWLAVAMGLKAVAAGASEWVGQTTSARVRTRLRAQLLGAVTRLGPRWLAQTGSGRVVTTAGAGIESLDGYVTRAVPAIVAAGITPPIVLAAIGVTDWPSLLILAVTLPLVPVFLALIGITTKRHMDRQWATLAKLSGQFLDLLEGLTTLKIYGRSQTQVRAVREGTDRYRRHTLATLRVAFLSGLVLDLLATLSVALVAVAVGLRLDHGQLSLGRALVVLLLAPEVFAPLRAVGAQHHATEEARAVIDETMAILDEDNHQSSPANEVGPLFVLNATNQGVIASLREVGLIYPGRDLPALHDVDLDVYAAQLAVVTGPSGAGKTSLLALLLGQLSPSSGTITVGAEGRPLPAGPGAGLWKAKVAWVPQLPRPTQDTVAGEVRLGDPTLDDTGLDDILARCAAPDGSTLVGEDGTALSAGQRRRVAVARAVARARRVARDGHIPLVVLDEPTEDLDTLTEGVVARVVTDLAGFAAVIVATHDLNLVALADRAIQIYDGRIIADTVRAARRPDLSEGAALVNVQAAPTTATSSPDPPSPGRVLGLRAALVAAVGARRSLALACLFGALGGISGLALTATSVWLICRAAQHPNVQALAIAIVGVRTFALAKALLRYLERLSAHDGALRLLAEVRARVFAALVPLAPAGLAGFRRGDLLRRFTSDVDGAQEALIRSVVPLAGAGVTAGAATVLVGLVDVSAAWILGTGLLVAGVIIPLLTARAGRGRIEKRAAAGQRAALVTGLLDGLDELTAYDGVDQRLAQIGEADRQAWYATASASRAGAAGAAFAGITAALTITATVAIGARAVAAGHTSGILLGVLAVSALVAFDALSTLPAAYAALGRCWGSVRRVDEVLAAPVPVPTPDQPAGLPAEISGIAGSNITVRPAAGVVPVLVDADFAVHRGERVAVIGPSGSGKSTLLAALLRLAPTEGPVALLQAGGPPVAVADLLPAQLPPLVAGSLQGDHVFATTLRDNLRVVAPAATDDDLDAIAERVGLAQWVTTLPNGWSTQAGPDGRQLSGGQRQRLLLARALLADPQLLVLDEPAAHLDAATEATVMADLLRSTAGRTLIMSTHRAGLLDEFDQVLTVDQLHLTGAAPAVEPAR